jgi:hypothetical protein
MHMHRLARSEEFPMLPSDNAVKNLKAAVRGFSFPMVPAF